MGNPEVDTGKLMMLRHINGLTYDQIGDIVGLTGSAVFQRLDKYESLFRDADVNGAFQARESAVLAGLRAKLLAHAAKDGQIEKLSSYAAIGSYGLLFDKQRVIDGKSTANIAVLTKLVESAQESGDNALIKREIGEDKAKS